MSGRELAEAMAREALTRLGSAETNLDEAQRRYDDALMAHSRAVRALADVGGPVNCPTCAAPSWNAAVNPGLRCLPCERAAALAPPARPDAAVAAGGEGDG